MADGQLGGRELDGWAYQQQQAAVKLRQVDSRRTSLQQAGGRAGKGYASYRSDSN